MLRSILGALLFLSVPIALQANALWNYFYWNQVYVGIDGGLITSLSKGSLPLQVGAAQNSLVTSAQFLPSGFVGFKIGYNHSPCIRSDLSYSFISSKYTWALTNGESSPNHKLALANIDVQVLLANIYFSLDKKSFVPSVCGLKPYLMGGIGTSWNYLKDSSIYATVSTNNPYVLLNVIDAYTAANLAGRFGAGCVAQFSSGFAIDAGLHVTYIGDIRTGSDYRTLSTGIVSSITPYVFKNTYLGALYLNLSYMF